MLSMFIHVLTMPPASTSVLVCNSAIPVQAAAATHFKPAARHGSLAPLLSTFSCCSLWMRARGDTPSIWTLLSAEQSDPCLLSASIQEVW
jgi:hypothetical protein